MYRSLLVPLDGSAFAEEALRLAVRIGQCAGATLQLLTVAPPGTFLSGEQQSEVLSSWRLYLDRTAQRVRGPDMRVSAAVLEGPVAATIQSHAASTGADLVVMSTHGRGALGRFWLGSVANELLHTLPMPLLLVRPAETPPVNEPALKHFLVPLDGGTLAEQILEPTIALGTLVDADYTLLRVIDVVPLGNPALSPVALSSPAVELLDEIRAVQAQVHQEAETYLEAVAGRLRGRGLRVQTRVIEAVDPALAILEMAVPPASDLVALETRGRRGYFLLGSVARKVIHGMSIPVLVQSATTLEKAPGKAGVL